MIFIAPPDSNCFANDIHSNAAHYCVIVTGSIKGAAPPAFNTTLERVALKQASRNPLLQATFKQAALYTQLSKPPPTLKQAHPFNALLSEQVLIIFIAQLTIIVLLMIFIALSHGPLLYYSDRVYKRSRSARHSTQHWKGSRSSKRLGTFRCKQHSSKPPSTLN